MTTEMSDADAVVFELTLATALLRSAVAKARKVESDHPGFLAGLADTHPNAAAYLTAKLADAAAEGTDPTPENFADRRTDDGGAA